MPDDGPTLAWLVQACKAPDGSYWALQRWQRLKPNFGGTRWTVGAAPLPLEQARSRELVMYQNWAFDRYRHIFGRLTYDGVGVYGFKATGAGDPLDDYGRNIYLDTFNSCVRQGLASARQLPHASPWPHTGGLLLRLLRARRASARQRDEVPRDCRGPGVTPDVMWSADDIGGFKAPVQRQQQALERSWGDPKCRT